MEGRRDYPLHIQCWGTREQPAIEPTPWPTDPYLAHAGILQEQGSTPNPCFVIHPFTPHRQDHKTSLLKSSQKASLKRQGIRKQSMRTVAKRQFTQQGCLDKNLLTDNFSLTFVIKVHPSPPSQALSAGSQRPDQCRVPREGHNPSAWQTDTAAQGELKPVYLAVLQTLSRRK